MGRTDIEKTFNKRTENLLSQFFEFFVKAFLSMMQRMMTDEIFFLMNENFCYVHSTLIGRTVIKHSINVLLVSMYTFVKVHSPLEFYIEF